VLPPITVPTTRRNSYLLLSVLSFALAAAYFQAKGVNALFGRHLQAHTTRGERGGRTPSGGQPGELRPTADAVLARNPFDSVTGPLLPRPAFKGGPISLSLGSRIHRLGPNQFIVERSAFNEMAEAMSSSMNPPIAPVLEDGKVIGVRVFGVRPDTVLGALGMENGDLLHSLNGYDLTDPTSSLEAAAHALHAQVLSLTVSRGARKLTLEYAIQ
jgi:hypothetical protein